MSYKPALAIFVLLVFFVAIASAIAIVLYQMGVFN